MRTIDWLPPGPLSVDDCAELADTVDAIDEANPIFGLMPDASKTVIVLFADCRDGCLWAAYHPAERAWVELDRGEPADLITSYARVADHMGAFVEEQYPNRQVALLGGAFGTV